MPTSEGEKRSRSTLRASVSIVVGSTSCAPAADAYAPAENRLDLIFRQMHGGAIVRRHLAADWMMYFAEVGLDRRDTLSARNALRRSPPTPWTCPW